MIESLRSLVEQAGHSDVFAVAKGEETFDGGTSGNPSFSLIQALGGNLTASGIRVTPDSAMQATAVNACVRVYAESVATVPLLTYRRRGAGKERAADSTIYDLLHDRPNSWMSSFEWREWMERQRCLKGNGYSLIERNGRGDITALYPLEKVQVLKGTDRLPYYRVSDMAGMPVLPHTQIFHLRNQSKDGYCGLGYIAEAMDAVGLTIALEQFGSSLFANGANMRGFFHYETALKPEDLSALREKLQATYAGLKKANAPGVLDGGWNWVQTSMKADEAQFLESRNYQVEDIARLFRMPALMIGHSDKASTYASAEQFFLSFVVHSLQPVVKRWEGALNRSIFTENEADLYTEFLLDGLLRGDIKSRYAAYAVARQWGWLNVDEIRERENLNPLPDGKGQTYLEPMNMREAGEDTERLIGDGRKSTEYLDDLSKLIRSSSSELEEELINA